MSKNKTKQKTNKRQKQNKKTQPKFKKKLTPLPPPSMTPPPPHHQIYINRQKDTYLMSQHLCGVHQLWFFRSSRGLITTKTKIFEIFGCFCREERGILRGVLTDGVALREEGDFLEGVWERNRKERDFFVCLF